MKITGYTRPFAVLGHPITHTLSPAMHNAAFEALGWDAIYLAFDVKPDRLMAVLPAMRSMGFGGVNLTIPHKEIAFRNLEHLDESAKLLGAVNTVQFAENGRMVGHNTDGIGFIRALEEAFGKAVEGDAVFVLGAGGAGRACALMAAKEGARSVTLSDVDLERCQRVAAEIRERFPGVEVRVAAGSVEQTAYAREADLVVQATPIGMKDGEESVLKPEAFRTGQRAFDLIYHLPKTVFMKAATEGGALAANGLGMLLHQGVKAFQIWTGVEPPIEEMRRALKRAVYGI